MRNYSELEQVHFAHTYVLPGQIESTNTLKFVLQLQDILDLQQGPAGFGDYWVSVKFVSFFKGVQGWQSKPNVVAINSLQTRHNIKDKGCVVYFPLKTIEIENCFIAQGGSEEYSKITGTVNSNIEFYLTSSTGERISVVKETINPAECLLGVNLVRTKRSAIGN